jgi:hypothetical protein
MPSKNPKANAPPSTKKTTERTVKQLVKKQVIKKQLPKKQTSKKQVTERKLNKQEQKPEKISKTRKIQTAEGWKRSMLKLKKQKKD